MANPEVSVIISSHNRERYIRKTVESALNQTFCDFELIIADSGSTGDTRRMLETYGEGRFRIITNEKNLSRAACLNTAIKESKGKYCAFMEAGDISMPDRLFRQVKFLNANPDIAVLGSAYYEIDKDGIFIRPVRKFRNDEYIKMHLSLKLKETCLSQNTMMCRKEALLDIGCYSDDSEPFEDDMLLLRMASGGYTFSNLKEPLLKKRCMHDNNGDDILKDVRDSHLHLFDSLYRRYKDLRIMPPRHSLVGEWERSSYGELYFKVGRGLRTRSHLSFARRALFMALRYYPFENDENIAYPAFFLWLDTLPLQKPLFEGIRASLRTDNARVKFFRALKKRSTYNKINSAWTIALCLLNALGPSPR